MEVKFVSRAWGKSLSEEGLSFLLMGSLEADVRGEGLSGRDSVREGSGQKGGFLLDFGRIIRSGTELSVNFLCFAARKRGAFAVGAKFSASSTSAPPASYCEGGASGATLVLVCL